MSERYTLCRAAAAAAICHHGLLPAAADCRRDGLVPAAACGDAGPDAGTNRGTHAGAGPPESLPDPGAGTGTDGAQAEAN